MKNIFILPTDKASKLFIDIDDNKLKLTTPIAGEYMMNRHIYITNKEEINIGCYYLCKLSMKPLKCTGDEYFNNIDEEKIIMTTDQDLIKDGVQEIDDEFLEWFTNNPSCEFVEIKHQHIDEIGIGEEWAFHSKNNNDYYTVIIPEEEQSKDEIDKFFVDMVCKPKPYAWVGVLNGNIYVPEKYELKDIYSGDNALPNFTTEQECQTWCNSFNNNNLNCPYQFTSRCTIGRCNCKPKKEILEEKTRTEGIGLNLSQLEKNLDNSLATETTESLSNWLNNKRKPTTKKQENVETYARDYARKMWGMYYDNEYDAVTDLTYGEACEKDFLAGVEYQKQQNKSLYTEEEVYSIAKNAFELYRNNILDDEELEQEFERVIKIWLKKK